MTATSDSLDAPASHLDIDVALVPAQAAAWSERVVVVIDELRASSTVTTALDQGCTHVVVTASLGLARRLARERGAVLAGERGGRIVPGFDADNSPVELRRLGVAGREVVLTTTNGTAVLHRLQRMPVVLMGCLLNARACAEAALDEAGTGGYPIGLVCAGRHGRFALDDAVGAGVIAMRIMEAATCRGIDCSVSDSTRSVMRLRSAYPDELTALRESGSGMLLAGFGADEDVAFCARTDSSSAVPVLRERAPLTMERRLHIK